MKNNSWFRAGIIVPLVMLAAVIVTGMNSCEQMCSSLSITVTDKPLVEEKQVPPWTIMSEGPDGPYTFTWMEGRLYPVDFKTRQEAEWLMNKMRNTFDSLNGREERFKPIEPNDTNGN